MGEICLCVMREKILGEKWVRERGEHKRKWVCFEYGMGVNMSFPILCTRFQHIFPHSTTLYHFYEKKLKKTLRANLSTFKNI